jgi:hypothetical protein
MNGANDDSVDDSVDNSVDMVCRQTSYTREEAIQMLQTFGDPEKVIRAYMNPVLREKQKPENAHQMIFFEIGKFVEETSQQPVRRKTAN